ncbi:MAG: type II secretion system protein [Gemmatimonadetes bacterium]|nr:MAG: type II secretion system protein [Gemmatimonadota bacterium]
MTQSTRTAFSLVEMVVVMVIFSLVLGVVYTALHFTSDTTRKRGIQGELEDAGHHLLAELINEIGGALELINPDKTQIRILGAHHQVLDFRFQEGNVTKNGIPLHPHDVKITHFELTYFSYDGLDRNQNGQVDVFDFMDVGNVQERFLMVPDIRLSEARQLEVTPGDIRPSGAPPVAIHFVQITVTLSKDGIERELRSSTALRNPH